MNLIETLVSEKIADNPFHASNMLNVLDCGKLPDDEARIARCRLYKAWKLTGENKTVARKKAIEGIEPPMQLFDKLPCGHPLTAVVQADEGTAFCGECVREKQADEYIEAEAEHYAGYFKDVMEGKAG